jgi:hypothetical protein
MISQMNLRWLSRSEKMATRYPKKSLFLALLVFVFLGVPQVAADEVSDAAAKVSQALDALFVKSGRSGPMLREALQPHQLRALIAEGPAASTLKGARILELYSRPIPDLRKAKFFQPRIAAVGKATAAWLESLPRLDLAEVVELIESDRPAYVAVSEETVNKSKMALDKAAADVDSHIKLHPSDGDESWEDYLSWPELKQLIVKTPLPLAKLQSLLNRFSVNKEGLEATAFLQFRAALRDYMNAYYFSTNEKSEQMYHAQMDLLATKLKSYLDNSNNNDAWAIGRLVGWLDRVDQAPVVRGSIREKFFASNFHLQVSQNLLSSSEPILLEDSTEIVDVIMKAKVKGVAETKGQVTLELVPNGDLAALKVKVRGISITNSVASRSGVEVLSLTTTQLAAEKTIFFGPLGITSTPSTAKCSSDVKILDIKAPSAGYLLIAQKNTAKNKEKVEELASLRAESMLSERMDKESVEMLDKGAEAYIEKFRLPLIRKGGFPEEMNLWTTSQAVMGKLVQINWNQVAAGHEAPALEGSPDLAVRLHESFVRNFSESTIGGYTLTDKKLEEVLTEMGAEIPEELQTDSGREPWSITFSSNQPVSLAINDGVLTFAIRGRQFTDGDRVIRETIEIGASYRIEKTDEGSRLVRQGEVEVNFVGRTRLTAKQIAFRTVMRRKFAALFKEEMSADGFTFGGRWENSGTMKISQLVADKGWLVLAWKLSKTGVRTATRP